MISTVSVNTTVSFNRKLWRSECWGGLFPAMFSDSDADEMFPEPLKMSSLLLFFFHRILLCWASSVQQMAARRRFFATTAIHQMSTVVNAAVRRTAQLSADFASYTTGRVLFCHEFQCWMNEWVCEWVNEWIPQRTSSWMNEWMNEQSNKRTNDRVNERMNQTT